MGFCDLSWIREPLKCFLTIQISVLCDHTWVLILSYIQQQRRLIWGCKLMELILWNNILNISWWMFSGWLTSFANEKVPFLFRIFFPSKYWLCDMFGREDFLKWPNTTFLLSSNILTPYCPSLYLVFQWHWPPGCSTNKLLCLSALDIFFSCTSFLECFPFSSPPPYIL